MRVETGGLIYDSEHPKCSALIHQTQGQLFAFVTALDIGMPHRPHKNPIQKRYWGKFTWDDQEGSITAILEHGGKWPKLNHGGDDE